ncbi:MAG: fibronectin/fibrinogen-binding protein [Ruminococcaceae bacterium]|nr:fibronectin/fibrinogen-binding protein [Oscillospiraceae bacterium]
MAFDAGMLACTLHEIREESLGARVEKVYQPERDEIILQIRSKSGGKRLLINAGANNPRIGFSTEQKENPQNPPMLCVLLRKHLQGAKLISVEQAGFERVVTLGFETRDEMGYACEVFLVAEVMGKYSNLIFIDGKEKILAALKTIDFSTSSLRQVLPGMKYELPPKQDKQDPLTVTREEFMSLAETEGDGKPCDKFILSSFLGISAAVAREISYRATGSTDTLCDGYNASALYREFSALMEKIRTNDFSPTLICKGDTPVEYAFCDLLQYGKDFTHKSIGGAGELLDLYFGSRDREQRVRQRASDVQKLLNNALARITKKLELQRAELADCAKGEAYKKEGDVITANIYLLKRGMKEALLPDYESYGEDGNPRMLKIELDERLTPAANAQRLYKKYNKSKNAKIELTKQIDLDLVEIEYLQSVLDALERAESPSDLAEIREELHKSGYAKRMKPESSGRRPSTPTVAKFKTDDGLTVLCGKNNIQNEYITFRLASKMDYWFHAKNVAGSHVVLVCDGKEPTDRDFTQAAEIAAYHSKAYGGQNIAVDYSLAKNIKKPAAARPGLVIYHTNWTAYVTPHADDIRRLRVK